MANDLTAASSTEDRPQTVTLTNDGSVFEILQNDRRRMVILALTDRDDGIPIDSLAESIAAEETDEADPPEKAYKSAYVALQQTHIPKLSDAGVVWFDQQTGVLYPGPNLEDVRFYLEQTSPSSERWRSPELLLGFVGLLVTGGAALGVPLVSAVTIEIWAVLFLGAVFAVNLYRVLER